MAYHPEQEPDQALPWKAYTVNAFSHHGAAYYDDTFHRGPRELRPALTDPFAVATVDGVPMEQSRAIPPSAHVAALYGHPTATPRPSALVANELNDMLNLMDRMNQRRLMAADREQLARMGAEQRARELDANGTMFVAPDGRRLPPSAMYIL